jgi:hypothetical protein
MKKTMFRKGKFMMVLDPKVLRELETRANRIGVTIQELLKVRAVPEFLWGPITLNPQLIRELDRKGYFKNGKKP